MVISYNFLTTPHVHSNATVNISKRPPFFKISNDYFLYYMYFFFFFLILDNV